MAKTVTVQEAERQIEEPISLAEQGEEIVIAQNDRPKVKLVPVASEKVGRRVFGQYRGRIRITDG